MAERRAPELKSACMSGCELVERLCAAESQSTRKGRQPYVCAVKYSVFTLALGEQVAFLTSSLALYREQIRCTEELVQENRRTVDALQRSKAIQEESFQTPNETAKGPTIDSHVSEDDGVSSEQSAEASALGVKDAGGCLTSLLGMRVCLPPVEDLVAQSECEWGQRYVWAPRGHSELSSTAPTNVLSQSSFVMSRYGPQAERRRALRDIYGTSQPHDLGGFAFNPTVTSREAQGSARNVQSKQSVKRSRVPRAALPVGVAEHHKSNIRRLDRLIGSRGKHGRHRHRRHRQKKRKRSREVEDG